MMSEESFHKNFMNESNTKKNLVNLVDYSVADVSQYLTLVSISQLTQNGIIHSTYAFSEKGRLRT